MYEADLKKKKIILKCYASIISSNPYIVLFHEGYIKVTSADTLKNFQYLLGFLNYFFQPWPEWIRLNDLWNSLILKIEFVKIYLNYLLIKIIQ